MHDSSMWFIYVELSIDRRATRFREETTRPMSKFTLNVKYRGAISSVDSVVFLNPKGSKSECAIVSPDVLFKIL